MEWFENDPRLSVNKRANIIVVDRRSLYLKTCVGEVETKNGWSIYLEFENYRCISANAEWPEGFVWTWAPTGGVFTEPKTKLAS